MILTSPTESDIDFWLAQEKVAKNGSVFIPKDDYWQLDPTTSSANVKKAKASVKKEIEAWLVAALSYYAQESSARTVNLITSILSRCAASKLNVLDEIDALAIRNRFNRNEFSTLRRFIKKWREEYSLSVFPSEEVVSAFKALKPNKNAGPCPVESMDPVKGPFTLNEMQAIFEWSNDSYASGNFPIEVFVYIRLLIAIGARRSQLQKLVFKDIIYTDGEAVIKMPKSKGRVFGYRDGFKSYKIAPDLYDLLRGYQSIVLRRLKDEKPEVDWDKALPNVPLFCAKGKNKDGAIIDAPDLKDLEFSPQIKFHKPDSSMSLLLSKVSKYPGFPISERTGERIHLGSHRFRHTLGTDMSRMGFGPYVIASALSHEGIGSVGRYIKTSPEMGKRIDDKMKEEMALVVNAFQGRLVENASSAINGALPNKTIRGQSAAIATCGADSNCHLDAPVACYTCSKFQPWLEGPHEEVLERLKLRQERAIGAAGKNSDSAISFDRPILAVMQVIKKIKEKSGR